MLRNKLTTRALLFFPVAVKIMIDSALPRGDLGVRLPPPLRLRGPLARGGGPARRHGLRPQEAPRPSVGLVRGADSAVPRPQIRRKLDHVRGTHCVKVQAVQNLSPPPPYPIYQRDTGWPVTRWLELTPFQRVVTVTPSNILTTLPDLYSIAVYFRIRRMSSPQQQQSSPEGRSKVEPYGGIYVGEEKGEGDITEKPAKIIEAFF